VFVDIPINIRAVYVGKTHLNIWLEIGNYGQIASNCRVTC